MPLHADVLLVLEALGPFVVGDLHKKSCEWMGGRREARGSELRP